MTVRVMPDAIAPKSLSQLPMDILIGAAINTVFSLLFTWLVFHGQASIPTTGGMSLITDSIPQSFMVALMSVLPVSLIIRARAKKQNPLSSPFEGLWWGRHSLALRAVLVALTAAAVGFVGHLLLAPWLAPHGLSFSHALIFKAVYGAALTVVIVPFAAATALKDVA